MAGSEAGLASAALTSNPYGAAFMAASGVLSQGMSAAPAGPSQASAANASGFDGSGWIVNYGSGSASGATSAASPLTGYMPYVLAVIAGLVLWRMTKH